MLEETSGEFAEPLGSLEHCQDCFQRLTALSKNDLRGELEDPF